MLRHRTGTLSGAAQNLLNLLYPAAPVVANDYACTWLALQADTSDAQPIFIGDENLTTVDYGVRIPPPTAGPPADATPVQIGPFATEAPVKLSSVFVIGTAGEKLHVLFVVR